MIYKGITVENLISELEKFNPNAKVSIMAFGAIHPFSLIFGHNGNESMDALVKPENCDNVAFYLEDCEQQESESVG